MAVLNKTNCKLLKKTTEVDGEKMTSPFITHPKFENDLRLLAGSRDEPMSFDDVVKHCKANPQWREQLELRRAENESGAWYYARLSNSVTEEVDV